MTSGGPGSDGPSSGRRSTAWTGDAAAGWAFAFAAVSFYWAAGGTQGLGTLAETLREQAVARDQGFITVIWITGALKVLAGLLALALVRPWGKVFPRWMLLTAGWGTGAFLTLYGGLDMIGAGLGVIGITDPVDPTGARWYLVLWGPVWLAGGLLMLGAVRHYTRQSRRSPGDQVVASLA